MLETYTSTARSRKRLLKSSIPLTTWSVSTQRRVASASAASIACLAASIFASSIATAASRSFKASTTAASSASANLRIAAASARRFEASCLFSRASRIESVSPIAFSPVETKSKDMAMRKRACQIRFFTLAL